MEQSWNCGVESSTAEDGTVSFTLSPVDYNREIPAGEHTQGIGFIISRTENYELKAYQLEAVIEGVAVTVTDDGQSGESLAEQGQDNHQSDDSQTGIIKEETQNGQTGGSSDGSQIQTVQVNPAVYRERGAVHGRHQADCGFRYNAYRCFRQCRTASRCQHTRTGVVS